MTNPLNLSKLTVAGPFWTADVAVVSLDAPEKSLGLRRLFLDQTRYPVGSGPKPDQMLAPNTLIALCTVQQVTITLGSGPQAATYKWQRDPKAAPPALASFDDVQQAIRRGNAALLLLATKPEEWPQQAGGKIPTQTLLAGDISLDALAPQKSGLDLLEKALGLTTPLGESIRPPGRLSVHASGLSILGQATLPWLKKPISALFQLSKVIAPEASGSLAYQLTIEGERLTTGEREALIAAARRLSEILNPTYPLNDTIPADAAVPELMTLELANPTALPRIFWPIPEWGTAGRLSFSAGQINLLISDRQPYRSDRLPTSLARIVPDRVTITADGGGQLIVDVTGGAAAKLPGPKATPLPDSLSYRYVAGTSPEEDIELSAITTAYNPIEVAETIRIAQELAVPEWNSRGKETLQDPLIWGFVPLDDGWAQLPVLNVSEQIYIDAGIARLDDDVPAKDSSGVAIQGAVSFSNRQLDGSLIDKNEHPWSLTISGATGVAGRWMLTPSGDSYRLAQIDLSIARPELLVNGLLWLSRGRPTIESALPDLDNWIDGLGSLPLRRVRTRQVGGQEVAADRFPALLCFKLETLTLSVPAPASDPRLAGWALAYQVGNPRLAISSGAESKPPTIAALIDRLFVGAADGSVSALLSADLLSRYQALLWRHHPSLPMIQALPLTQTKSPPNAPIASRQLAPFALPTQPGPTPLAAEPAGWRFGVTIPEKATESPEKDTWSGATSWPTLLGGSTPASEWQTLPDLPMAALSLPGLILSPSPYTAGSGLPAGWLPLQYRYDLPYTDEVQALAQMPKVLQKSDEVTPLPDDPLPATPKPLLRADYAAHWRRLSEQASLAAADAVEAFDQEADGTVIRNLIEPYRWPVVPALDLDQYPGTLTLGAPGGTNHALVLRGGDPAVDGSGAMVPGSSDAALMGIGGQFRADAARGLIALAPGDPQAILVQAGSMAAYRTPQGLVRDQRGLGRAATTVGAQLIATDLQLENPDAEGDQVSLTSTRVALELTVVSEHTWQLWFRDLPIRADIFERAVNISPLSQDINDPEATAREFNYLRGYEWRLADQAFPGGGSQALRIAGLEFYPLTLDWVKLDGGAVSEVTISGRLQLPLSKEPVELDDLSNVVRVSFVAGTAGLALDSVVIDSADGAAAGEWPLALSNGELTNAPRILWGNIRYDSTDRSLTLDDAQLCFSLFDAPWKLPLDPGSVCFRADREKLDLNLALGDTGAALVPVACTLTLVPGGNQAGSHTLTLDLVIRLHSNERIVKEKTIVQRGFQARVRFIILGQNAGQLELQEARLFEDIVLASAEKPEPVSLALVERTLQFVWQEWQSAPSDLALLPGMLIGSGDAPGCAIVSFTVKAGETSPILTPTLGYIEAVIDAGWGSFLQADEHDRVDEALVFDPAAGALSFGYTAHLVDDTTIQPDTTGLRWDEHFLLNGFLEVKSLISWPAGLAFDQSSGTLTIPGIAHNGSTDLSHMRHTLRVLLNQHEPPAGTLLLATNANTLFELNPERPWQLLAAVEHQLIDIDLSPGPEGSTTLRLGTDRRWSVSQEVRLMAPQSLRVFLQKIGETTLRTVDPVTGLAPLTDHGEGYFDPAVRARLIDAINQLDDQEPCILVEASAPHWIRRTDLNDSRPTVLQYLPTGSQHAILSGPHDYAPAPPESEDGAWLLLTMPFLGRILPTSGTPTPTNNPGDDPVRLLQQALAAGAEPDPLLLMLTNRSRNRADLWLSHLETAAGRTWARLDPLSLDENWFRLHTLPPEDLPERLPSVTAALPDTPGRAGRSTALRRSFDVFRPFVPPASPPDSVLADAVRYQVPGEVSGAELVWRERSLLAPASVGKASTLAAPVVTRGLQLLYSFAEQRGTVINDSSGVGQPFPLRIVDQNKNKDRVKWLAGGGLRIDQPTTILSDEPPARLIAACQQTNEITIELWIEPKDITASDPGRILTLSSDISHRNFTIQQGSFDVPKPARGVYHARLRTTKTDDEGMPALYTPLDSARKQLTHLVFTRSAAGERRLYLDGQLVAHNNDKGEGTFAKWNTGYKLALANEAAVQGKAGDERPWLGTYRMLAIYSQALTDNEVAANFAARPDSFSGGWRTTAALLASAGLLARSRAGEVARDYFVAATLIPARLSVTRAGRDKPVTLANPQPLGFAVSPYLALSFRSRPAKRSLVMAVAELICVDLTSGLLSPVASSLFNVDGEADLDTRIAGWAREQQRLLAPESRAALVRMREIYQRSDEKHDQGNGAQDAPDASASLVTGYRFLIIDNPNARDRLRGQTAPLRAAVKCLRFREGQYAGNQLPKTLALFELAPPQTVGVQPVVLSERPVPSAPAQDAPAADQGIRWPWGLSGLRFSVRYTDRQRGAASAQDNAQNGGAQDSPTPTLWWQSFQYHVQFRSALHETPLFSLSLSKEALFHSGSVATVKEEFKAYQIPLSEDSTISIEKPSAVWAIDDPINQVRYRVRKREHDLAVSRRSAPAAGLPPLFRARPIHSLLPVAAHAPLPPAELCLRSDSLAANAPTHQHWQPVLPGSLRYMLTGTRPGVMIATRAAVTSQHIAELPAHVSGSVPVQHRTPRPVALPPNQRGRESIALRTWASYLEPERNILVSAQPVDEAFYASDDLLTSSGPDKLPARRLRLRLLNLDAGVVPLDWDGQLLLELTTEAELLPSDLKATLSAGSESFELVWRFKATGNTSGVGRQISCEPSSAPQREAIQRQLRTLSPKAALKLQVEVGASIKPPSKVWPFSQMLTLDLRMAKPAAPPLPLRPQFIHFEDPEYNRILATQAGRAERMLKLQVAGKNQHELFGFVLATDRRSYNSDSPLALIFSTDRAEGLPALDIQFDRVTRDGVVEQLFLMNSNPKRLPLANLALLQLRLSDLRLKHSQNRIALEPDHKLRITVFANGQPWKQYKLPEAAAEIVHIDVDIVAEPVIPAPAAAYALLRHQYSNGKEPIECVRFAWGPDASRIDLVSQNDLLQGVVRRRAIFLWRDVARVGTSASYAVQKITASGSTHIPTTWEGDRGA